ncbi:MAG: cupin domain-containing protein [Bdellovibrionaceae bacterium]|nr:cupin domain-containing protein [Pseudobdellovibrionaceae bacterium]
MKKPTAVKSLDVPLRAKPSIYPEPFCSMMVGREKRQLGEIFGLKNFGVNITRMKPNAQSSLMHKHAKQDEFIFILEGEPTLITEDDEMQLSPGMCAGFAAGGLAHQLVNRTDKDVLYIEVGDRTANDEVTYPCDDIKGTLDQNGQWVFTRKDGSSY